MKNRKTFKILIAIFPILFLLIMLYLRTYHSTFYDIIGKEDNVIEWMQFIFFLSSAILAIFIAVNMGKLSKLMRVIFIIISLGLMFVAFEEISWGERVFNIDAPEIFEEDSDIPILEYNVQSEMNLHNFRPIHNLVGKAYVLIATYSIFAYFISLLFFKYKDISKEDKFYLSFFTPPPYLILYFFPLFINLLDRKALGIRAQDYEMTEFLFSLAVLIFLLICTYRIKNATESMGKDKKKV